VADMSRSTKFKSQALKIVLKNAEKSLENSLNYFSKWWLDFVMKTTHTVKKTARVRQEFHPSDFESVQSKMDNFWEISGVL